MLRLKIPWSILLERSHALGKKKEKRNEYVHIVSRHCRVLTYIISNFLILFLNAFDSGYKLVHLLGGQLMCILVSRACIGWGVLWMHSVFVYSNVNTMRGMFAFAAEFCWEKEHILAHTTFVAFFFLCRVCSHIAEKKSQQVHNKICIKILTICCGFCCRFCFKNPCTH